MHEEQKGNWETTQRMGNKVTDRAKVGSCFSFSHFCVRSLFFIPPFSSILAYGHGRISGRRFSPPGGREARTGNTSVSAAQASSIQDHLLCFRKVLLGI